MAFNTVGGLSSPSGGIFTNSTWDGENISGPTEVDENNGTGHYYNPDTSPVTFTWTQFFTGPACGSQCAWLAWAGRVAAFKGQ